MARFLDAAMTERKRLQVPVSTLCLLVAVVALSLALFLLTARHNAQLVEQAARFAAQTREMTDRHNAQLSELAAKINGTTPGTAPTDGATGSGP